MLPSQWIFSGSKRAPGHAEQWRQRHRGMDQADGGAVLRRLGKQIVGGQEAAGARHALDDEIRLAGNVVAHMRGKQPGIHRRPRHRRS